MSDVRVAKHLFPFADPSYVLTPGHLTDDQVQRMHDVDAQAAAQSQIEDSQDFLAYSNIVASNNIPPPPPRPFTRARAAEQPAVVQGSAASAPLQGLIPTQVVEEQQPVAQHPSSSVTMGRQRQS